MRTISKQFTHWLNVVLMLALLSNLLLPVARASASSGEGSPSAWPPNGYSHEASPPGPGGPGLTANVADRDIAGSTQSLPAPSSAPPPRTFSLPFNFKAETLSLKPALVPLQNGWQLSSQINGGNPTFVSAPAGAVQGEAAYAVWVDNRTGHSNVFLAKSSDGGQSWAPANDPLTNFPPEVGVPSLPEVALDGDGTIYVAFHYSGDGEDGGAVWGLYVIRSDDGGQLWSPLDLPAVVISRPSQLKVAVSEGHLYLVWQEGMGNYTLRCQATTRNTQQRQLEMPIILDCLTENLIIR